MLTVIKTNSGGRTKSVHGVTYLDKKIFIIHNESSVIEVYTDKYSTFSRLDDIEITGMKDPYDIVGCNETQQLFITDWGLPGIWRVPVRQSTDVVKSPTHQLFVATGYKPWTMSTSSRRLLVTTSAVQPPYSLYLYDVLDGQLLRTIETPEYMSPSHVVETKRCTFVVAYVTMEVLVDHSSWTEVTVTENGRHRPVFSMSELNSDGFVVKETDFKQFNEPEHLLVDSKRRILIADSGNNQVIVLDDKLKFERILLDYTLNGREAQQSERVSSKPWRMSFNANNKRLVVGMNHSNVVYVYHWN